MSLSTLAWKGFAFGFGALNLPLFLLLASLRKPNFKKLTAQEKKELVDARERLWDLEQRPFGLDHRFCVLRNGAKLHYVESVQREQTTTSNLVIFLHGYPDSYALWKDYLQNPQLITKATLIAVDLPGFGGSDSLELYGPEQVLEAVTEFILKMREQYLTGENGRVVIVSHDWGAIIGCRLSAEAPQLADHFIISNCVHPPLAVANVRSRVVSAWQMIKTWIRSPFNVRLLRRAFSNLAPVLKQSVLSGYVFVFNLPFPLANMIGKVGDFWWFRYLNAVSTHPDPAKPIPGVHGAEMLASSVGPSLRECSTAVNGSDLAYSDSVRRRASTGGFQDKICYYRHGLAFSPWEKSIETIFELNQLSQRATREQSASSTAMFDTSPEGAFKAPTTIIWGKGDIAVQTSIALDGIQDYFGVKNSQLVMIARAGHWSPLSIPGIPVFEQVIEWAINPGKLSLQEKLGDSHPTAQLVSSR